MSRILRIIALVVLLLVPVGLVLTAACSPAAKRAPILVAQTGVAVSASIGEISKAAAQLQQAAILPAAAALRVQEGLLRANTALQPLPDLLRAIDAAQTAGESAEGNVEKAIAILQAVTPEIAVLLAGVPVTETTQALIELVRAAQTATTTVLLELAKIRQLQPA